MNSQNNNVSETTVGSLASKYVTFPIREHGLWKKYKDAVATFDTRRNNFNKRHRRFGKKN